LFEAMESGTISEPAETVVRESLIRMGLVTADEAVAFTPLEGGVSSAIWRVDAAERTFCVKRALARLKVAAEWRVPVARNAYEAAWYETVGERVPGAAPALLGHDPAAGLLVMEYLEPGRYRLWKAELLAGRAEVSVATAVGDRLGAIHAATAGDATLADRFASDAIFHAIRLEAYLEATARAHPDRADALHALAETTAATKRALAHGDVSPKNILCGPAGPVFLDAECAWYGDPAFDLAFCLNHLLLKCLYRPDRADAYLACFDALYGAYLPHVDWEDAAGFERRAARLLPGLMLARVDGKSPVEYLTAPADKDRVRETARDLLAYPPDRLSGVRGRWAADIGLKDGDC
jgi:aminoglycoside phosphotransferase (APT) family kinase protein